MGRPLDLDRQVIAGLCERFGVARMEVFGSAVTDSFDPASSDVDFLVEFRNDLDDVFTAYFGLKNALEVLLDRPVDLVSPKSLRNPYFAARVRETRELLYAA